MLKNVKILIPPSTGIQGGGQQFGPLLGNPGGWEKKTFNVKINIKIKAIL